MTDQLVLVATRRALELRRPGPRDQLRARLHADSLDRRLAAGEQPEAELLLAVRAAQLTAPRARSRLADAWVRLLGVERPHPLALSGRVPVDTAAVARADQQILVLAERLHGGRPVAARGVALARRLLSEPGPVYAVGVRRAGGCLADRVDEAVAALS